MDQVHSDRSTVSSAVAAGSIPSPALILGLGGLIPFVALAAASAAGRADDISAWAGLAQGSLSLHDLLVGYGAVILSFMGGVQWGLTMLLAGDDSRRQWQGFAASVVPALVAWPALFMPAPFSLLLVAGALVVLLLYDLQAIRAGRAPRWYASLRIILTIGAAGSLAIAALAA